MKKFGLVLLIAAGVSGEATANDEVQSFESGNSLLASCRASDPMDKRIVGAGVTPTTGHAEILRFAQSLPGKCPPRMAGLLTRIS